MRIFFYYITKIFFGHFFKIGFESLREKSLIYLYAFLFLFVCVV